MEIKIIDDVGYYYTKNGRMYPVETMKKYIDEYYKYNQTIIIDHQNNKQNDIIINTN